MASDLVWLIYDEILVYSLLMFYAKHWSSFGWGQMALFWHPAVSAAQQRVVTRPTASVSWDYSLNETFPAPFLFMAYNDY